jgi:serine/threonine protein kinase
MAIRVAIEGYDSLEQIGVGGMAAVYKARKVSIDKTVAIKVLFPYLASDGTFIERFQREAKAAASIQHENIVNVIDFGESEGSCYIVMEYYDGRTLEDLMKERAGIPLNVAAQLVLEVAYGLEAAHAQDIVHRDIKPANVIYTRQGGIKLADFGLAKKSDSATLITHHGKVMGTPAYMSPEQAAGRAVGPASDIFSLGVVAYELFGRRRPFEGRSYSEVLEKIQTIEPPALADATPLVDSNFNRVVGRMLAKNESGRYATASALVADLESAMDAAKITRDRRRLASYIKDPGGYESSANAEVINQCQSRGAFFMQKGNHHLDDAILEYRRILFLDPGNDRARKNLQTLREKRGDHNRTLQIDAAPVPNSATPAATTASPGNSRPAPSRRPRPHRRVPLKTYGAGVAGVVALIVALLWNAGGLNPTDEPVAQHAPLTSSLIDGRLATEPFETTPPTPMPAPAEDHDRPQERETAADDSRGSAKQSATPERKPVDPPRRQPEPAVPAPVADGTLTVFFLGGVGEVMLNGKSFPHEPPFSGVRVPAGQHRIACRMSGDAEPKEIVITVRPDRETVIEYEAGGTPRVVPNEETP